MISSHATNQSLRSIWKWICFKEFSFFDYWCILMRPWRSIFWNISLWENDFVCYLTLFDLFSKICWITFWAESFPVALVFLRFFNEFCESWKCFISYLQNMNDNKWVKIPSFKKQLKLHQLYHKGFQFYRIIPLK